MKIMLEQIEYQQRTKIISIAVSAAAAGIRNGLITASMMPWLRAARKKAIAWAERDSVTQASERLFIGPGFYAAPRQGDALYGRWLGCWGTAKHCNNFTAEWRFSLTRSSFASSPSARLGFDLPRCLSVCRSVSSAITPFLLKIRRAMQQLQWTNAGRVSSTRLTDPMSTRTKIRRYSRCCSLVSLMISNVDNLRVNGSNNSNNNNNNNNNKLFILLP
jgi:hypothetical protein